MPGVRGINIIGTGIDVDVLQRYEKLKRKTNFGYTKCLIQTLFNFEYSEFTAEFNGVKNDYRSFIACVANGKRYGGGLRICPGAAIDDGELNFVVIDKLKRSKIIGAFLKLKQGKIMSVNGAHMTLTDRIRITPAKASIVQVDGELYENIPFEVQVVHDTLKMYRP